MPINLYEDTEFNDALRKHGILPPRPKTPPSPSLPPSQSFEDCLDDLNDAELLELEEEAKNDETERRIRKYYEQRLEEQKRQASRARFGRVYPIGRDDYTREVTEASKVNEPGDEKEQGTGVVCFLYKDGIPRSDRATHQVNKLAHKHPRTKFVSIVGDKCIENLPDLRLPMFIVYRQGEIRNQIISWGADRERSFEDLEVMLIMSKAIDYSDQVPSSSHRGEDESEDDHDDTRTNARTEKNIRSSGDNSDSEFEFDI